jgi:predicted dehydrogenase
MSHFPQLAVRGCAARSTDHARAAAAEVGIGAYDSVAALLAAPDVEVVLNITPPLARAETTAAALAAGKHVYVEKPITTSLTEAQRLAAAAQAARLLLGSAPDTFLGSAAQTARRAVDDGLVGEPVGVAGFSSSNRVETWHPDPTPHFQPGGGPVSNMSPSYDAWDHHIPWLEVYGTQGTLSLPDPNTYDGDVLLKRHTDDEWQVLPPVIPLFAEPGSMDQYQRGPGVADLVAALDGAPQRAGAALACHVLDAIEAIETSSGSGATVTLTTWVDRPDPVRQPEGTPA